MAGEIAGAFVRVRPQMSGFKSETESTFKSTFGSLTKIVAGAAAVIGGTKILGGMIQEFSDSEKVGAQTNAVLKSTGSIANVSRGQVDSLAKALMNKSGVDDEAIKSGENMLLTFTSIRNEAGKGNDIFNQTSKTVLDMDTAMTHGNVTAESLAHTSILVGKALNDPIKGATALRRVGVSLDEQQQKMIKTMVAHNNIIGAQKIVLGELNKEFGGSAAAMGQTLPGKISILRENLKNLGGDLIGKLAPAFSQVVEIAIKHMPEISAVMDVVGNGISTVVTGVIVPVVKMIATVVQDVVRLVKPHWQEIKDDVTAVAAGFRQVVNAVVDFGGKYQGVLLPLAGAIGGIVLAVKAWELATAAWSVVTRIATAVQIAFDAVLTANPIGLVVLAIAGLVGALVVLYTRSQTVRDIVNGAFQSIRTIVSEVVLYLSALWKKYGDDLLRVAQSAFNAVKAVITTTIAVIRALWAEFGGALVSIARTYWDALKTYITTAINIIRDVIKIAVAVIHGDWGKAWSAMKDLVSTTVSGIAQILRDFLSIALTIAKAIGKAILDGIMAGLSALGALVTGALNALGGIISNVAGAAAGWAAHIGSQIIQGILSGVGGLYGQLKSKLESSLKSVLSSLNPFSPVAHGGEIYIGRPIAEGAIRGFLAAIPALAASINTKLRQVISGVTVQSAIPVLQTAIAPLNDAASNAFAELPNTVDRSLQSAFSKIPEKSFLNVVAKVGGKWMLTDVDQLVPLTKNIEKFLQEWSGRGLSPVHAKIAKEFWDQWGSAIIKESKSGGTRSLQSAGASTTPVVTSTFKGVGTAGGMSMVEGFLLGLNPLPDKINKKIKSALDAARTTIQTSQTLVGTAFTNLASYGTKAFEAATTAGLNKMQTAFNARIKKLVTDPLAAAMAALDKAHNAVLAGLDKEQAALTPTEKLLRDMQAGHDEAGRQQAISDARAGLTDAQKGGDPAQILQAQRALADAQYAETVATLQVQADLERTNEDAKIQRAKDAEDVRYSTQQIAIQKRYDAIQAGLQKEYDRQVLNYQSERDLQEAHLNATLTQLQASLAKHPGEWDAVHAQIMKMFKTSFGPDYKTAGKNLGTGFAKGIRESFGEVGSAVAELSALVAKFLKVKSPTELGPMSDLDTWWKALPETLVGSLGKGAIAAALTGALALGGGGGISLPGTSGSGVPQLTGALAPLGTLAVSNLQILDELRRQTAIAEQGKSVEVTVGGGGTSGGMTANDAARQAIR